MLWNCTRKTLKQEGSREDQRENRKEAEDLGDGERAEVDKGRLTLVCGPGENSARDRGSGRSHRRARKGGIGPGHSASADRGAQQTLADSDVSKGDKGASDTRRGAHCLRGME